MRLLDTNILSEILRKRPDAGVIRHLLAQPAAGLYASELTRFELRRGTCLRDDPEPLWDKIVKTILPLVQWLPADEAVSLRAAEISADLRRSGREIGLIDTFLAATATTHGLIMVTRNTRHFDRINGLKVENWFQKGTP
ncbi:MAG: type II toxin-antitoxin system VapC family toxin [Wenzhouxiangella sp.]